MGLMGWLKWGLLVGLLVEPSKDVAPSSPQAVRGEEATEIEPEEPTWRFRKPNKSQKVVVIAGSIGAFAGHSYAKDIERRCSAVEIRNLSKAGLGAYALKHRFRDEVVKNRHIDLRDQEYAYWLVYGGGINSVRQPESTNHHIRKTFALAHRVGMKVLGLSVTPWGALEDARFQASEGLKTWAATQKVAAFVLGRLSPREALGRYAEGREVVEAWLPEEVADIAIDLLNSDLRDADAPVGDLNEARKQLLSDRGWKRKHEKLDDVARTNALEVDAARLASLPQWFLREELRGFDHIHPNLKGHALIGQIICPQLPTEWECDCSAQDSVD